MEREERCQAAVYKRDTYRRTGRGSSGFEMHFKRCRCERRAVTDGLCKQHAAIAMRRDLTRVDW